MQFVYFHLMPWPHLDESFESERSAWVTYSNANYDPQRGAELYEQYLDQLVYAEELGFDAIAVNEHHQTAYGLMPSPDVIASYLVARTRKAKIAILGNATPLRDHPLRVAEEVAMMDVISSGRMICGFVRGIGPEYHNFTMNPANSLERFREAHDLIVESWTKPGPFRWEGKHYRFEYVKPVASAAPTAPSANLDPLPGQWRDHRVGGRAALHLHRHVYAIPERGPVHGPVPGGRPGLRLRRRTRTDGVGAPRLRRRDRPGRHRRGETPRRIPLQSARAPSAAGLLPARLPQRRLRQGGPPRLLGHR